VTRAVAATVGVVLVAAGCSGGSSSTATGTPQAIAIPSPPIATGGAPLATPEGYVRETCTEATANGASVVTFRSARDRCVPAAKLVSYRCEADLDPVIERRAGSTDASRFVGGRFAVAVHELPEGAKLAGRIGQTKVFVLPGLGRWLYVSEEGILSRWLALPQAERVTDPPSAFLMGDSILAGAELHIGDVLPGWTLIFDAEVGRASSSGATVTAQQAPLVRGVAVVELGTNDSDPVAFQANAASIMTSLEDMQMVVWVTVHSPDEVAVAVNGRIRRVVAATPNATLADWNHAVPDEALNADGVHLLPEYQGVFARFLAPHLRRWRAAATGHGATECAARVLASL
jgi:hypothetical protein